MWRETSGHRQRRSFCFVVFCDFLSPMLKTSPWSFGRYASQQLQIVDSVDLWEVVSRCLYMLRKSQEVSIKVYFRTSYLNASFTMFFFTTCMYSTEWSHLYRILCQIHNYIKKFSALVLYLVEYCTSVCILAFHKGSSLTYNAFSLLVCTDIYICEILRIFCTCTLLSSCSYSKSTAPVYVS